jgi:hypothetical protein
VKSRTWPLWVGVAVFAVVIGWMSGVFVQYLRVRRLLRDLRSNVEYYRPPSFRKTSRTLDTLADIQRHGCRALPVIMDELNPEAPAAYLEGLSTVFNEIIYSDQWPRPETNLYNLQVSEDDEPAEVRRKCERLRRWWAQEGSTYHQSWRFWSSACGTHR